MGFLLWGALTALTLGAGISVALRTGRDFAIGEQIVAGVVTALAIVVGAIQLLGYLDVLYGGALGTLVGTTDLALLTIACPAPGAWRVFGRRLGAAARSSVGLASLFAIGAALVAIAYLAAYVVLLPSWGWDALWYHNAMAAYAYQEHSLGWVATHIPFINSYPKNIELLALWNVIFSPDDRLLDAVQLPMTLIGVVAVATMCRRAGASAAVSLGLGLCWFFLPAVILNIPSDYNDAAVATLQIAAILFLARADATGAHRLFGTLALGLYMGSKVTGLLHAAILGVVVAVVLVFQVARAPERRLRLALQPLPMAIGILTLGSATYLRNWLRYRNPVWPVRVTVLGYTFPGTWGWQAFDTPPWGGSGGLDAIWRSFREKHGSYLVDIRPGGFGPLWLYVLLPAIGVALLVVLWRFRRGQPTPGMLPLVVLVATALATSAPWWARYILALPVAGLLAFAIVLPRLRWPIVGKVATAGLVAASLIQAWPARVGFFGPLDLLAKAWRLSPRERAALKVGGWTHPGIEYRDEVLQPGDAAVYDDSVTFVYQLWRSDWANRVLYRPLQGDPRQWLSGIEGEGARWAAIARGSRAEAALRGGHWIYLGRCSAENTDIWMRPRGPLPVATTK